MNPTVQSSFLEPAGGVGDLFAGASNGGRWMGWRLRALFALALVGCLCLFLMLRALVIEDLLRAIAALATCPGHSVINQLTVLRDLSRAENQGRVGGGILRLIQLHCRNISGVSDDSGVLTQRS